jgi:tRNA-dihydrouridine synthase
MPLPLYLAPMAGLSHRALRELVESFGGCDLYFSEMLSAPAVVSGGPNEKWYLDDGPCPARLVYQLCGASGEELAAAAAALEPSAALGIDINMGCSAPAIRRLGSGAAWLSRPHEAARALRAVRKASAKRLSVKLRIGPSDDFDYLFRFCALLVDEGVDALTLHPRTTKEKFKRRARWEYVSRLAARLPIPVAGNGDIDTAALGARRMEEENCAALMLGRLAVREPWIFARLKAGAAWEERAVNQEECALRFLELLERFQPPEYFQSRARLFFRYFCANAVWGTWLYNRLLREESALSMSRVLHTYFTEHEGGLDTPPGGAKRKE